MQVRLLDLFKIFARIGSTGFGGMAPLLAMVQEQMVERRKLVTPEEFAEGVAIGQILPGPIAVDTVTHLGYRLRGWKGAIVSTVGFILPAFLLMLVLTPAYFEYGHAPRLSGAFKGIGGAVVGIIIAATCRIAVKVLREPSSVAIALLAFLCLAFLKADAILTLVGCGALGWLAFRQRKGETIS